MNVEEQISQLLIQLADYEKRKYELNEWLIANFNSSEFSKKVSELNELSVKIKTVDFKINNLRKAEPLLGYLPEEQAIKKDNPKTNKSI